MAVPDRSDGRWSSSPIRATSSNSGRRPRSRAPDGQWWPRRRAPVRRPRSRDLPRRVLLAADRSMKGRKQSLPAIVWRRCPTAATSSSRRRRTTAERFPVLQRATLQLTLHTTPLGFGPTPCSLVGLRFSLPTVGANRGPPQSPHLLQIGGGDWCRWRTKMEERSSPRTAI